MSRLFVKSGKAMRMFLTMNVIFMLIGIWLTGFDKVHWFMYFLPVFLGTSALFGICPGINLWKIVFREK